MKILVTGANGMLGKDIVDILSEDRSLTVFPLDISASNKPNSLMADITDRKMLSGALSKADPEVIIHCAAITNVDTCEKNRELVQKLNVDATRDIASFKPGSTRLIYISTDSVFDGKRGNYSEDDTPNPRNCYAKSKLEGEKAALSENRNTLVLRTNIYGFHKPAGSSLAEWAIGELSKGNKLNGFHDVYFNPLYTKQLASTIKRLIAVKDIRGILNVAAGENISKYDFLLKIAGAFGYPRDQVRKTSIDASGLGAERPKNTTLNISRLKQLLNESPSIDDGIAELRNDARLPVSAIVCTYNEERRIRKCIESLLANNVNEIICVDGDSTDKTAEIARKMGVKVISDKKQGLVVASQMGAEAASSEYIFFVGPDNVIPAGIVASLIGEMGRLGYAGISPLTNYVAENNNYVSRALALYRKYKFRPGTSTVVGTPSMYKRTVFLKYGFDTRQKWNTDSNLSERMMKDGLKLGRVALYVYEGGYDNLQSIYKRWTMYGMSNCEYYRRFSKDWGFRRKIRSFSHPFRT